MDDIIFQFYKVFPLPVVFFQILRICADPRGKEEKKSNRAEKNELPHVIAHSKYSFIASGY